LRLKNPAKLRKLWLFGLLGTKVTTLSAMPFSPDDLAVLKGLFDQNSIKDEFKQFAEMQTATSHQLQEHMTKLTSDVIKVQGDIANLRAEYDKKIKELQDKMDTTSCASTAGSVSTPRTWASSDAKRPRTEMQRAAPMMEAPLPEGGNENRVWLHGFRRDFYSSYFLKIGADLIAKAGVDDVIAKQCKVRAFNMKQRFSIDFPAVGVARDFIRKVNGMGYVAVDPAAAGGDHPVLRAAQDRSKVDREKIAYMTKAWKVVHDTIATSEGWVRGMTLRSTGTDGVLFVENAEKTDGYKVVRLAFGTAVPTMDTNDQLLMNTFKLDEAAIVSLKEKIRAAWL
jgi:hypothetical protein